MGDTPTIVKPKDMLIGRDNTEDIILHLNSSLVIPSTIHTYSVITEWIRRWVVGKFKTNYFKHIHVQDKHVFGDFRNKSLNQLLKKEKPLLAIVPKINMDYNRDGLDTHMFDIDKIARAGRLNRATIRDYDKQNFLGHDFEQLEMEYTIMARVETKAQQLDLYKFIKMAFSSGHNFAFNIDIDYHLPYDMMTQMALDSGFELVDHTTQIKETTFKTKRIKNVVDFLNYVNSKSRLPVLFKYRAINGRTEFFLRARNVDLLIDNLDMPSYDDGERIGALNNNYNIEFSIRVMAPNIKYYLYYSTNKHNYVGGPSTYKPTDDCIIYPLYDIELLRIPRENSRGWNQYLITDYRIFKEELNKPLEVNFEELLDDKMYRIKDMCEFYKSSNISPNELVEFKVFTGEDRQLEIDVDWDTYSFKSKTNVTGESVKIALYVDTAVMHKMQEPLDKFNRDRAKKSK